MKYFTATVLATMATLGVSSRIRFPIDVEFNYPIQMHHKTSQDIGIEATGGVYLCINDKFNPPCEHLPVQLGQCTSVASGWNDKISAVGPDGDTVCYFYIDYYCGGNKLGPVGYGGYSDLRFVGDGSFNDAISSYRCEARTYD